MKINELSTIEDSTKSINAMNRLNSTLIAIFNKRFIKIEWNAPGTHEFLNYLTQSILFVAENKFKETKQVECIDSLIELMMLKVEYAINIMIGMIKHIKKRLNIETDYVENSNEVSTEHENNYITRNNVESLIENQELYLAILIKVEAFVENTVLNWSQIKNSDLLSNVSIVTNY